MVKQKRTIFVGVFQYKDKEYIIHCDFGCGYPEESAVWMFLEGNYCCDCNRSLFISREYGEDAIPELECGDEIKLKEYHIEYEECEDEVAKTINIGKFVFDEKITEAQDLSDAKFIPNRDDALDWNEIPQWEESEGKE